MYGIELVGHRVNVLLTLQNLLTHPGHHKPTELRRVVFLCLIEFRVLFLLSCFDKGVKVMLRLKVRVGLGLWHHKCVLCRLVRISKQNWGNLVDFRSPNLSQNVWLVYSFVNYCLSFALGASLKSFEDNFFPFVVEEVLGGFFVPLAAEHLEGLFVVDFLKQNMV